MTNTTHYSFDTSPCKTHTYLTERGTKYRGRAKTDEDEKKKGKKNGIVFGWAEKEGVLVIRGK